MTIHDAIRQRGLKASFGNGWLNPDIYEGVETVVFITEDDAPKMMGLDRHTTLFIVSDTREQCMIKLYDLTQMLIILEPTKTINGIKREGKILIK